MRTRAAALPLCLLVQCREPPPASPAPPVRLLGFAALELGAGGPTYLLDADSRLGLWRAPASAETPAPPAAAVLDEAGEPHRLPLALKTLADGATLARPDLTRSPGHVATLRWAGASFRLRFEVRPSDRPAVQAARARQRSGDLAGAAQLLERAVAETRGPARVAAAAERASLVRTGTPAEYRHAVARWAEVAREEGLPTEESRALRAAAFSHFYERDFRPVEGLIAAAERIDRPLDHVQGLARGLYYQSLLATELGRYRRALTQAEESASLALRHDLELELALARKARVAALVALGRHQEAATLLEEVALGIPGERRELRLGVHLDQSWVLARAMETGAIPADWGQVETAASRALGLARELADTNAELIAQTNLWYAEYLRGDLPAARRRLREIEALAAKGPSFAGSHALLFAAQLAWAEGDTGRAEGAYRRALAAAEADSGGGPSELGWRARQGLARTLGRRAPRAAAAEYLRAVEDVGQLATQTDLDQSRAAFLDERGGLYEEAVEALLATGRADLALLVADRSRSDGHRSLYARGAVERLSPAARERWRALGDEYQRLRAAFERRARQAPLVSRREEARFAAETARLRAELRAVFDRRQAILEEESAALRLDAAAPARIRAALSEDTELLVRWPAAQSPGWFRVTREGVHFADGARSERRREDGLGPAGTRRPPPRLQDLARRSRTAGAGHSLIATMSAEDPWAVIGGREVGLTWLEAGPVSFLPYPSLALGTATTAAARALVVADPRADLPHARREAAMAARALPAAEVLLGADATRDRVLAALAGAGHFHFAGHGVLTASDPWDIHLLLARGETLTVEDLLASRPGVRHVVLSGCSTGEARELGRQLALSLPLAFAAAGAETVLATTREVTDREARRFIEAFYREGGATRPAVAYRAAALGLASAGDTSWSAFYLQGAGR